MRKKYKFLIIIAFAIMLLILYLTIINKWEKDKGMNDVLTFSNTIQSVEIVDGTSGNKVSIVETDELNEIHSILQESKLIAALNSEDTTGYRWRVVIKLYNNLIEVTGSEKVIYDDEEFKFLNDNDYIRFEECITNLYNKYDEVPAN